MIPRRLLVFALSAVGFAGGCGGQSSPAPALSRAPISVRGWIADVEHPADGATRTVEAEMARRAQLFQSTSVFVENAPYVSGGVAENGSFVLLDVPPGNTRIAFTAPGAPEA